jgi:hypothetical protein
MMITREKLMSGMVDIMGRHKTDWMLAFRVRCARELLDFILPNLNAELSTAELPPQKSPEVVVDTGDGIFYSTHIVHAQIINGQWKVQVKIWQPEQPPCTNEFVAEGCEQFPTQSAELPVQGEAVAPNGYQNPTDESWFDHPADANLIEGLTIDEPLKVSEEYEITVGWTGKHKYRVLTLDEDGFVDEVEFVSGTQLYATTTKPSVNELVEALKASTSQLKTAISLLEFVDAVSVQYDTYIGSDKRKEVIAAIVDGTTLRLQQEQLIASHQSAKEQL